MSPGGEGVVKSLHTSKAGSLARLNWISEPAGSAPGSDKVVIETRAVGVNFKDILYAMDMLKPTIGDDVPLGLEIAGMVTRVGADVSGLAVGDRVMAMPPTVCFKTLVTTPAALVQKIPDDLSFEVAAAMPICYGTAIESLLNIGQLERRQSVLIHSAAGGVGHAAIQICQSIGSEIFCHSRQSGQGRLSRAELWNSEEPHIPFTRRVFCGQPPARDRRPRCRHCLELGVRRAFACLLGLRCRVW